MEGIFLAERKGPAGLFLQVKGPFLGARGPFLRVRILLLTGPFYGDWALSNGQYFTVTGPFLGGRGPLFLRREIICWGYYQPALALGNGPYLQGNGALFLRERAPYYQGFWGPFQVSQYRNLVLITLNVTNFFARKNNKFLQDFCKEIEILPKKKKSLHSKEILTPALILVKDNLPVTQVQGNRTLYPWWEISFTQGKYFSAGIFVAEIPAGKRNAGPSLRLRLHLTLTVTQG